MPSLRRPTSTDDVAASTRVSATPNTIKPGPPRRRAVATMPTPRAMSTMASIASNDRWTAPERSSSQPTPPNTSRPPTTWPSADRLSDTAADDRWSSPPWRAVPGELVAVMVRRIGTSRPPAIVPEADGASSCRTFASP
jgi:hypothetical protein